MNKKILVIIFTAFLLSGCSKPENREVTSEVVFAKVADATQFESKEKLNLKEIKNSQRYGISTDKIADGTAGFDENGKVADNLIIVRAADDSAVDSIEEAVLAYVNDISAAWENNETENDKIEDRVFETIDKFVMLYVGDKPDAAKSTFEECVRK